MYVDIKDKQELVAREAEISDLFEASFGRRLSAEDWRWFYVDNPVGPAYVSLFYEGDKLLGHYAVVPTALKVNGVSVIGYRSMTTMVHPDGRGRGLFTDLANRVYQMLEDDGAALVYGFPNGNSAHGFGKYLGWTVLPADRVVDIKGAELLDDPDLWSVLTGSAAIQWDMTASEQNAWRFSAPNAIVTSRAGLVTKLYDSTLNVLHIGPEGRSGIDGEAVYRVLVPESFRSEEMEARKLFDYRFGFRIFDPRYVGLSFRRELVLSDVF